MSKITYGQNKTERINFRITKNMKEIIVENAEKEKKTMTQYIMGLIKKDSAHKRK